MKYPTIINYLETIENPKDRFKTLTNFEINKVNGKPQYKAGNNRVEFYGHLKGRSCAICCQLSGEVFTDVRSSIVIKHINYANPPYLFNFEILPQEIYVFDNSNNGRYYDVLFWPIYDGTSLDNVLLKNVSSGDKSATQRLLCTFIEFAKYLVINRPFVHNILRPSNVFVFLDGSISLLDYRNMVTPGFPEFPGYVGNDNICLVTMALLIYGSITDSSIAVEASDLSVMEDLIKYIIERFKTSKEPIVQEALDFIENSKGEDNARVVAIMDGLLKCDTTAVEVKALYEKQKKDYTIQSLSLEGVSCAVRNGKYGYVSGDNVVIDFIYDWASDFEEGLAIVKKGSDFGVINKSGAEILPIEYEDVSWLADNGVIIASKNGKWRLFNRNGETVSTTSYDRIGDFSQSLVCVEKKGKCGFIDRAGKVVIPLIYDETTSFNSNGLASVKVGKDKFIIDTKGHKVL